VRSLCRIASLLGALALAAAAAASASAQTYPAKPVKIITSGAANVGDIVARRLASSLQGRWGVPVIVENRPGVGNTIATSAVARAAPDGYTEPVEEPALRSVEGPGSDHPRRNDAAHPRGTRLRRSRQSSAVHGVAAQAGSDPFLLLGTPPPETISRTSF
jgi:hypothetical protein